MILEEYEHNFSKILKTKKRDNIEYMMQIVFFKNILEVIKNGMGK